MKTSSITAAELHVKLNADPEWVKRKAERDAYWKEVRTRYQREEKPLIEELGSVGVDVENLGALVKRKEPYPAAIPILLRHLQMTYSDNIRELIARSLAVPDAAYAHEQLIAELYKDVQAQPPERAIRNTVQGLACAVAASTTEENIPSLISLIKDESLGDDRLLFLRRLRRSKRPDAAELLANLERDPVFSKEIKSWRRKKQIMRDDAEAPG